MVNPNWFVYHKPTDVTAPKFTTIREVELETQRIINAVEFEVVNGLCLKFANVVDELCPECDDKKRAIDAIRLARNGANEYLVLIRQGFNDTNLRTFVEMKLIEARWLANSAIALEGK